MRENGGGAAFFEDWGGDQFDTGKRCSPTSGPQKKPSQGKKEVTETLALQRHLLPVGPTQVARRRARDLDAHQASSSAGRCKEPRVLPVSPPSTFSAPAPSASRPFPTPWQDEAATAWCRCAPGTSAGGAAWAPCPC